MNFKRRYHVLVLAIAFALTACNSGQNTKQTAETHEAKVRKVASGPEFTEEMKVNALEMAHQVKMARTKLAGKLGVSANEIKVIRAESVTWSNGSIGCPEKDMSYTQAVVPGTLIVLWHSDEEFEYHSGSEGDPFLCSNPQSPIAKTRPD